MTNSEFYRSGCGCLAIIIGIVIVIVSRIVSYSPSTILDGDTLETYPRKTVIPANEEIVSEEDNKYLNNSLSTGSAPYKSFYGKNYKCLKEQCSGIRVTAPHQSDIVVIIKRNNSEGQVISHAYIKAGETCFFPVPDGTYQTFFYYGEGWNPNKEMAEGITGGFVKNELFSKDSPQEIYNGILTYVLQLKHDGNFQTQHSNKQEMF